MPFFDRFWWLRALGALLAGAAAVWILWAVAHSLTDPTVMFISSALPGALILLLLAGISLALAIGARQAHDRANRRRAVIDGNQDAMPRSRFGATTDSAPDLANAPLIITYPIGWLDHPVIARMRLWVRIAWIPLWCAMLILIFTPISFTPVFKVVFALGLGLIFIFDFSVWGVRKAFFKTHRMPRRMTANADGILWEPILGRNRLIRWQDARLLEETRFVTRVGWPGEPVECLRYTLYTQGSAIWWTDPGNLYASPSDDLAALLAAITARTGLVPRTLDSDLRVRDRSLQINTTGAFALPTTHARFDADAAYELVLALPVPTARSSIIAGTIGAVLSAAGVLAVLWALDRLRVFTMPPALLRYTGWLNAVVAFFLAFGGLIGLLLLVAALFGQLIRPRLSIPRVSVIRADATALSQLNARLPLSIPWSAVTRIKSVRFPRGRRMYVVRADDSDQTIMWSGGGSGRIPLTPESGARLITPEELVALVAARSGKPVEIQR